MAGMMIRAARQLMGAVACFCMGATAVVAQRDTTGTIRTVSPAHTAKASSDGDAAARVEKLQQYLKNNAGDDDARTALARAQLATGSAQNSLATAQEVLARNPNSADALLVRGFAQQRLGEQDAARADFKRVVTLAPDYCDAHIALVNNLVADGQTSSAAEALEAMPANCQTTTGSRDFERLSQRVELGLHPERACDPAWWDRQTTWPREAEDPRLTEARKRLLNDDVQGAEQLVDEVLGDAPSDGDAHVLKARIEMRRGKDTEAEKRLVEVLRRGEAYGYCDARLLLATVRLRLQDPDGAKSAIQDCPYCTRSADAQRLLQQAEVANNAPPVQTPAATPTPRSTGSTPARSTNRSSSRSR